MQLGNTVFVLFAFTLFAGVWGQSSGPLLNEETATFVNGLLERWSSPAGLSIAVVRRNQEGSWQVETGGYGRASADGTKVTAETMFGIGSNSKLLDAVATGLLIHNETLSPRLTWTTRLAHVIPGFALQDPVASNATTITDAMSHRTGMPRHDPSVKVNNTVEQVIEKMKYQRPSAEFRDVWQYNNLMYIALSYLPTAVLPSKPSFARYVKENIFDRLGMAHTTYSSEVANATGALAKGITRQHNPGDPNPLSGTGIDMPYWEPSDENGGVYAGPGGAISNAKDMATWLQTLLSDGHHPQTGEIVIPAAVLQKVSTGISVEQGASTWPEISPIVYGAGQERVSYRGLEIIEHAGDTPGFHSIVSRLPFDNFGVAILSNDNDVGPYLVQILRFWLIDQAFGLKKIDWEGRVRELLLGNVSQTSTTRPSDASFPNGDISSLAGVYDNKGYGEVEFCYASVNNTNASESCKALVSSPQVKAIVEQPFPTLLANWGNQFVSHVALNHFDGLVFNVSGVSIIPTGNSSSPWLLVPGFSTEATAEFDRSLKAIAFKGFWGAGSGVPSPQGNTLEERAEVWFTKVN